MHKNVPKHCNMYEISQKIENYIKTLQIVPNLAEGNIMGQNIPKCTKYIKTRWDVISENVP